MTDITTGAAGGTAPERPDGLVQRVKLLTGHTSPDTAYVVDDYPYGRRVRCEIRYWVETGTKGAGKGRQRFVSQTTNPKYGNDWARPNMPKAGTYSDMVFMYLDPDTGHVEHFSISRTFITPEGAARFYQRGLRDQVSDVERQVIDGWFEAARKSYPEPWVRFAERVRMLAAHLAANDGKLPDVDNGRWVRDDGEVVYLGSAYELPVYFTAAWGAWCKTLGNPAEPAEEPTAEEPTTARAVQVAPTPAPPVGGGEPEPDADEVLAVVDDHAEAAVETAEPDDEVDPDDVEDDTDEIDDEDAELAAANAAFAEAFAAFMAS